MLALESLGANPLTIDFGGHSDRVTPVPIPNTEVKPVSADGTWGEIPWESRTPPDFALDERRIDGDIGRRSSSFSAQNAVVVLGPDCSRRMRAE